MKPQNLLPKRVAGYIHEIGARALDHLAEHTKVRRREGGNGAGSDAVQSLVGHWKSMADDEKDKFVDRVAASVIEVVAASAALPLGLKLAKKALKRQKKKLRNVAKRASAAGNLKKKSKTKTKAKAKDKSKPKDTQKKTNKG